MWDRNNAYEDSDPSGFAPGDTNRKAIMALEAVLAHTEYLTGS
jgi:hypothetical protein